MLENPLYAAAVTWGWAERAKGDIPEILEAAGRELMPLLEAKGDDLSTEECARLEAWARRLLISGDEDGEVEEDPVEMLELAERFSLAGWIAQAGGLVGPAKISDFGQVRRGTPGDDVHDLRENPPCLLIDPGGNDTYIAPARGTGGHPVCVVIDLGGNDRYGNGEDLSCGAGLFGIGILIDRGGGDDVYRSGHMSQGCGVFGVGILSDDGGNDVYECKDTGQGAGAWGVGLLLDRGEGNDRFHADLFGQGFAYVGGFGLLHNEAGNDVYDAGGVHKHQIRWCFAVPSSWRAKERHLLRNAVLKAKLVPRGRLEEDAVITSDAVAAALYCQEREHHGLREEGRLSADRLQQHAAADRADHSRHRAGADVDGEGAAHELARHHIADHRAPRETLQQRRHIFVPRRLLSGCRRGRRRGHMGESEGLQRKRRRLPATAVITQTLRQVFSHRLQGASTSTASAIHGLRQRNVLCHQHRRAEVVEVIVESRLILRFQARTLPAGPAAHRRRGRRGRRG